MIDELMKNPELPSIDYEGKFHFCYVTVNNINNKLYIGKHSTSKLLDEYIGSGSYLSNAVNKYGSDKFRRIELKFFLTAEDALLFESQLFTNK